MTLPAGGRLPAPLTRRLTILLVAITVLLGAVHVILQFSWSIHRSTPEAVRNLWNLTQDYSVPSWFGFACLALTGFTCVAWGRRGGRGGTVTGLLFLFLAGDDAAMLHERLGGVVDPLFAGVAVYSWVLVMGPVLAVLGVWSGLRLVRGLSPDRRGQAAVLLGFGCLAAALCLEFFERRLEDSGVRWRTQPLSGYFQTVEELLEFLGPILVFWAVGSALERRGRGAAANGSP